MRIILPALVVAFAAFCIWLGVRIVNRRERWAKWMLSATLALPVLYVASFGPAARCATSQLIRVDTFVDLYWPIIRLSEKSDVVKRLLNWYLWISTDSNITID
jgi:hypothetical protein